MARAAELLVFAGVVMICVYLAVCAYNHRKSTRSRTPNYAEEPWELTEHSDGELLCVYCEHPGDEPLLVGSAPWASQDFQDQIEVVRSEGRLKLAALNSGRKKRL